MTTAIVFIAIIFMMWYTEKVKSDTINKIESKFERKIKYRDYCGVIYFNSDRNKFCCEFAGTEELLPDIITGEKFLSFKKASETDYFKIESDTESGALEQFCSHVDFILDDHQSFLNDDDMLLEFAEKNNISIEEAKTIRYMELYSLELTKNSERRENTKFRYDLHFPFHRSDKHRKSSKERQ